MQKRYLLLTSLWGVLVLAIAGGCRSIPKGAVAVKPFDINRYLGKWYEIARFDFRFEKDLNNVTAAYSMNKDGTIHVVNRGFNYKTNKWKQATGKAKFAGAKDEGRLKVSFFGPFYSGYNVLAIDPEYKYALVAGKNLGYLWILSREKTLPPHVRNAYLGLAKKVGFNTSKLLWVEQNK